MGCNIYFEGNEYHTPRDRKRDFGDKLSLGTSFYFNCRYLKELFKNRKLALSGVYDTERWALSSFEIMTFIEDCGGKFHITGLENVEAVKDEPVVFVSNHMSALETFVFPCLIAPVKPVVFVVKDSLTKNFIFGPIMRARNPIAVGRKDPRADFVKVLSEGQTKISEGSSVIVFPQSTRTVDFVPETFNSMGVKLAIKAGVKVVPIAIKTDFWLNGRLVKDLARVRRQNEIHIKFGEPISVVSNGKAEHQAIVDFIKENFDVWSK